MKKPKVKKKKGYWIVYTNKTNQSICYTLEGLQWAIRLLTSTNKGEVNQ